MIAVIAIILVLAGSGVGTYYFYKHAHASGAIKRQAIFLTNGQVYFGEIIKKDSSFLTIKNIYYLKTQDQLDGSTDAANKKISLIKLGDELHGPEDIMQINLNQILYYEDMKDSSKINEAIENFINKSK